VNQKTISRRSFSQVIHTPAEHNFSGFLVATRIKLAGTKKGGGFPVILVKLHRHPEGFQSGFAVTVA
jgi:hypothetical protein